MNKILIVDDEPDILEVLQYNLLQEGYQVEIASNGQEALEKADIFSPELIIMDVMMPILNGIEAGKKLKENPKHSEVHLVYLSARSEESTEISAFDIGANDYLTKPIKMKALLSRINAFFRKDQTKQQVFLSVAGLEINKETYTVKLPDGKNCILPKKEFDLLFLLANKPNKIITRTEILEKIWGKDIYVGDRTIDVHIRKIREKIGENYLKTVKGVGYMFADKA